MFDRDAASGGAAGLYCADLLFIARSFAHLVYYFFKSRAQGKFDETGILYFSDEREHLCSCALFSAEFRKFCSTDRDDERDVEPGFDIVDVCRMFP